MALGVYDHSYASGYCRSVNPGDIGGLLRSRRPDADRVGLGRHALAPNLDVVAPGGQVSPPSVAQRDIVASGGVVLERISASGRVFATRGVVREREKTG